jgi:hypothetical protein
MLAQMSAASPTIGALTIDDWPPVGHNKDGEVQDSVLGDVPN